MGHEFTVTKEEWNLISAALQQGHDVRLHPDKYGLKITAEKVRVLSRRELPEPETERRR